MSSRDAFFSFALAAIEHLLRGLAHSTSSLEGRQADRHIVRK